MSGAASNNRGKVTERMAVTWFRGHGFDGCERVRRTGYATRVRTADDESDLDLCPGVVAQVKSLRPANRMERAVPGWMAETEAQRQAAGAEVALLVVRRDGTTDVGEWWAFLPWEILYALVQGLRAAHLSASTKVPVRFLVADAARLLRAAGYGTPLAEEATA